MLVKNQHVPNLLIASSEKEPEETFHIFRNKTLEDARSYSCIEQFLDWLENQIIHTRKIIVIAHNFKGYNSYSIIDAYHRRCQFIDQLRVGGKVLQLTSDKLYFIDSSSFFQMPLRLFPKTFGMEELEKRHCPHGFNTPENQDYIGPLPDKKCYFPNSMSISEKTKIRHVV